MAALPTGTVLDGEIIALGINQKPDFLRVLQRDFVRSAAKAMTLSKSLAVHYMVFDVLWHKNKPVYALPLTQRLKILERLGFSSAPVLQSTA